MIPVRAVLLASSQCFCSVDADARCKRNLSGAQETRRARLLAHFHAVFRNNRLATRPPPPTSPFGLGNPGSATAKCIWQWPEMSESIIDPVFKYKPGYFPPLFLLMRQTMIRTRSRNIIAHIIPMNQPADATLCVCGSVMKERQRLNSAHNLRYFSDKPYTYLSHTKFTFCLLLLWKEKKRLQKLEIGRFPLKMSILRKK